MSLYDEGRNRRGDRSAQHVDWLRRQWKRYDTMIDSFTKHGNDDAARKALCLAFVRSVLDDTTTERLLSDALFEITGRMVDECEDALGVEKVANARAPLLFLLWSLPSCRWKEETYEALRVYLCRNNSERPAISFRHFLGSTLRTLTRNIVDPLADIMECLL